MYKSLCALHAGVTLLGFSLARTTLVPASLSTEWLWGRCGGEVTSSYYNLSLLPCEGARSRYNLRYAVAMAGAEACLFSHVRGGKCSQLLMPPHRKETR